MQQTEQVLITQFGRPVRVITQAGLHAKIPFVQTVISFDYWTDNLAKLTEKMDAFLQQ